MALNYLGNIQHGEKYADKNTGEDKWKNTDLGTLWQDPDDGSYVVKYLGQWCKVWPPKIKEEHFEEVKKAVQNTEDEIPF